MRMGSQRHVPAASPSGKRQGTHHTVGWVGPKADLEEYEKPHHHRNPNPGPSSV
jgi:hypothetical protein